LFFFALQKRKKIFIYFSRITMPPTTESQEWFKDWLEKASKEEIVEFYVKKDKEKSEKTDILQDGINTIIKKIAHQKGQLSKEVKALEAKKSPKQQNISKKSAPPDKETDVKQLEAANKKLQLEKKELQQALADVLEKHEQIICCRICEENFDNSEERVPVKLKCSHVFCASCANSWLAAHVIILKLPCLKIFNFLFQGQKATCPQCRTIYRAGDIKPVNFNL